VVSINHEYIYIYLYLETFRGTTETAWSRVELSGEDNVSSAAGEFRDHNHVGPPLTGDVCVESVRDVFGVCPRRVVVVVVLPTPVS